MSSKNIVIILALVLLLVGGFLFVRSKNRYQNPQEPVTVDNTQAEPSVDNPASDSAVTKDNQTVTIDANGFSPKNVTIKAGESVTWSNKDTAVHEVNSVIHPTHQVYPPLNTIGLLKAGQQKSLSFPDKGTYKFHDHLNPQFSGAVTVQ